MSDRITKTVVFSGSAVLVAGLMIAILLMTGGHFAYVLDDAYIYLALAENLPFNYSVNAPGAEAGAPSSSILYPYLLMPLAHTSLALFGPLLISFAGAVPVLLLLLRLERQIALLPDLSPAHRGGAVLAFAVLINLFALVFTGMEHTLHVAAALGVLGGLIDLTEGRAPRWWFWLAIVAGPLLRYEALALSLPALVFAGTCGYTRRSVWVSVLTLAGPVVFGFYLVSMGYSWLPSSVLAKSYLLISVDEGMSGLMSLLSVWGNFTLNLLEPTALIHVVLLAILLGLLRNSPQRGLLLVVILAAAAQLLLGKFGWMGRYHAWALALMLLTIFYVARGRIKTGLLVEMAVLAGMTGLIYTAITPPVAAHVYRYHSTLHDFVTGYWKDDIAALDIGYLSWENPHTVVDLFGLASERIRRLVHKPHADQAIIQLLADEHIGLIIAEPKLLDTYNSPQWKLAGELQLSSLFWVTGLNPRFYLTDPARADELRQKLEAFRPRLPQGVTLKVYE